MSEGEGAKTCTLKGMLEGMRRLHKVNEENRDPVTGMTPMGKALKRADEKSKEAK